MASDIKSVALRMREPSAKALGRLTTLGVKDPRQLPLFFPSAWEDNRQPLSLGQLLGEKGSFCLKLVAVPGTFKISSSGAGPELQGCVYGAEQNQHCPIKIKGKIADLKRYPGLYKTPGGPGLMVRATLTWRQFSGAPTPVLREARILHGRDLGRVAPIYAGRQGVISGQTVTDRISEMIDSNPRCFDEAASWFVEELLRHQNISERKEITSAQAEEMVLIAVSRILGILDHSRCGIERRLSRLLIQAHGRAISDSADIDSVCRLAEQAQDSLARAAAMGAYLKARQNTPSTAKASRFSNPGSWEARARQLPYSLTAEQSAGVDRIVTDIAAGRPVRYLISGDVGTGKTAVFATVAMSVIDGGGRVSIMLPRQSLANQIYSEMTTYWPELLDNGRSALLVGGKVPAGVKDAALVIGTTALIHKDTGTFDLVVTDEQQAYSREQREALSCADTHFLESTATAIPRTQALMLYGAMKQVRLTKPHTPKDITTRIVDTRPQSRQAMMERIRACIDSGGQVIAVYPSRRDRPDYPLLSAESMMDIWETIAPGRVRLAHGGRKPAENEASIEDVKSRRADILVCTTVVEVGLTIPGARYLAVAHPDRYGLSTLHQLRGRLCRHGGKGDFDMVLSRDAKPSKDLLKRLQVLVDTDDGFEIAERDMKLRGSGDLGASSSQQRGADHGLLPNRIISSEEVLGAIQTLRALTPLINKRLRSAEQNPASV